jgi:ferritin-like metal-binding protein YciE
LTLEEEKQTDEKLTKLARQINAQVSPVSKEVDEAKTG